MTEEVMMVSTKEFDRLVQYYKGEITDNALLNKAGRLAAESPVILSDKTIPDLIAIKKIKPLARQRGCLTKRIEKLVLCRVVVLMSAKRKMRRKEIW